MREGGGSIVAYETWLENRDDELLEAIRAYNEEDCRSTLALRDWLWNAMRVEAAAEFGVDFAELAEPEPDERRPPPEWLPEVEALIARLGADDPERELLAYLLLYHRREGKPGWWRYFDLRGKTLDELVDERDAIGLLELDASVPPLPVKRSLDYASLPAQEFRLRSGDVEDPTTGEGYSVVSLEEDHVILTRGVNRPPPEPRALIDRRRSAPRSCVRRCWSSPRRSSPATGASTRPARCCAASRRAARPGRTSSSRPRGPSTARSCRSRAARHRQDLPRRADDRRRAARRPARRAHRAEPRGDPEPAGGRRDPRPRDRRRLRRRLQGRGLRRRRGHRRRSNDEVTDEHQLVAGTAWLFAREEHREAFDLLFIDEAGQFSLADAVAAATAADNLVLLGDPQQLPQVTQADHPGGSGASVLEHLLDGDATIPPDRGVLLTETWRMHPDVCAFVSERSYDGRLHSRDACAGRRVDAAGALTGAGLRTLPVEHEGRSQASPEEARRSPRPARSCSPARPLPTTTGETRPLQPADIMVVAPYNLAVTASATGCRPACASAPSTASRASRPPSSSTR